MPAVNLLCHPWDIVEQGVDAALDVVKGRIGATGICLPLSTGSVRHLRFMKEAAPRWFTSRGGVFFQPRRDHYASTRCTPVMSDWLKGRNPLANVSQGCAAHGLALRVRLECTCFGRIAERYPLAARKNVFGDPSPSQICLINPDVRELIRALGADVREGYGVECVELTGLDAMWPPDMDMEHTIGGGARQLMALCFCESCRQSAAHDAVPVAEAARSVTVRLERLLSSGGRIDPPVAALAADDPPLAAFIEWYRERIAELFRALRNEGFSRVVSHTRPMSAAEVRAEGETYPGADAVLVSFAGSDTGALSELLFAVNAARDLRRDWEMEFSLRPHFSSEPQALVRNLAAAAEAGASGVTLDCLGHIPSEGLETVCQAVRFARRTGRQGGSS